MTAHSTHYFQVCHGRLCPTTITVPLKREQSTEALKEAGWRRVEVKRGRINRVRVYCPDCAARYVLTGAA